MVPIGPTDDGRGRMNVPWQHPDTRRRPVLAPGCCNFTVNILDGIVTHPNLVKLRGYVARSGAVRASVTVPDKCAAGSGRLSGTTGRATWSGYSGNARCGGY